MFDLEVIEPSQVSFTPIVAYVFVLTYFFVFIVILALALAHSSQVETDVEWGLIRHNVVLFEPDEDMPPSYDEAVHLTHLDVFVIGDDEDDGYLADEDVFVIGDGSDDEDSLMC